MLMFFRAIEALAAAELNYVIRFDKTKIIQYPEYEELDHEEMFQRIFLVDRGLAQRYFEIAKQMEAKETELMTSTWHF